MIPGLTRPQQLRPRTGALVPVDPEPGDPFTMPLGIRNYGASEVPSGSIVQFGIPVDQARGLDPAVVTYALARDSDSTPIPVQVDLTSTTRVGGHLCYAVGTAKLPFALASETTSQCTLTATPGGLYSGGAETVTVSDLEARDFNVTVTGDDVTTLAVASLNDYVYRRKIKSGSVETGWEGWSRFKESGSSAGQWCMRWRAMAKGDASLDDWRIEATVFCSSPTPSTHFGSGARGRTGTFILRAGSTVLNDHSDFEDVFVSGNTGFALYAGGDSLRCAHGGATLRPVHDRDYLVASRAIWPFRCAADDSDGVSTVLGSFDDAYVPGQLGGFRTNWGAGGVDATIGPLAGVSYNALRSLSDDDKWRRGYDAGLKTLGAAIHCLDPATGYVKPKFGSYAGLGTSSHTRDAIGTTYDAAGASRMVAETGHYCNAAYIPGLLTGEMAFVDACAGLWDTTSKDGTYRRPQCAGRDRREYPYLFPAHSITRYDDWPHGMLAHQHYLSDDSRHDKSYVAAILAETAAWCQDLYADKLQWSTMSPGQDVAAPWTAFNGNPGSSNSVYPLGLTQFNSTNAPDPMLADVPWSVDFRMYILYLIAARNGEAYPAAAMDSFFTRYMIGRAVGPDMCVAYSAEFAPLSAESRVSPVPPQTWTDYWQRYNSGGSVGTRDTCTVPTAPNEGNGYAHKYINALNLLHRLGLDGEYGASYLDAYEAVDACFGAASPSTWDETVGGRWVMERI